MPPGGTSAAGHREMARRVGEAARVQPDQHPGPPTVPRSPAPSTNQLVSGTPVRTITTLPTTNISPPTVAADVDGREVDLRLVPARVRPEARGAAQVRRSCDQRLLCRVDCCAARTRPPGSLPLHPSTARSSAAI